MHSNEITIAGIAASEESCSPALRETIRAALAPHIEQLQHDVALISGALAGPDPEFALSLLVDVLSEVPTKIREVERQLAHVGAAASVAA